LANTRKLRLETRLCGCRRHRLRVCAEARQELFRRPSLVELKAQLLKCRFIAFHDSRDIGVQVERHACEFGIVGVLKKAIKDSSL
jgi:hypothetical protein